jgi:hypothetical protein
VVVDDDDSFVGALGGDVAAFGVDVDGHVAGAACGECSGDGFSEEGDGFACDGAFEGAARVGVGAEDDALAGLNVAHFLLVEGDLDAHGVERGDFAEEFIAAEEVADFFVEVASEDGACVVCAEHEVAGVLGGFGEAGLVGEPGCFCLLLFGWALEADGACDGGLCNAETVFDEDEVLGEFAIFEACERLACFDLLAFVDEDFGEET